MKFTRFFRVTFTLLLVLYSLVVLTPFVLVLLNSFKSLSELVRFPFNLPQHWSGSNFVQAWQRAGLGLAFANSTLVTGTSILGVLLITSLTANILSRYDFPLRRSIYLLILLGLALPARLAIIPIYTILRSLGLVNSYLGLIIVYVATGISFGVFLLKGFMDSIPREIEESARLDGASIFRIYLHIILPLSSQGLVVVAFVNFINVFNDFFFPLIIISDRLKRTVPLAVSIFFGEYSNRWDLIAASLSISVFPVVILFFIFSKYFVSGMTSGSIK